MDLPKMEGFKVFMTSQFSYFPLIWMLYSRTINNRINNIHKRALRMAYKDNQSSFKQLLEKYHSVTVYHKNLQVLVTEIFKVIRLYTCNHSIFTVWCNYDALVSFTVVTIIFYMYLFNLYLDLVIYVCT